MTTSVLPSDADARHRIVTDLDHTLFVEAGAGSGKTSSLVGRFVSLVLAGADVTGIAAITFTEAAAAELRARIREGLEDVVAGRAVRRVTTDEHSVDRARAGLERLDRASISTLHAFAQRILTSAPIEAGLPPRVEVHDEVSSALRADERWAGFVQRLLDDDDLEPCLRAATALDVGMEHLASVAATLNQNWDLLVGVDLTADRSIVVDDTTLVVSIQPMLDAAEHAREMAATCTDTSDRLLRWIEDDMTESLEPLRAATSNPFALLQATKHPPTCSGHGRAANWPEGAKGEIQRVWNDARDELLAARARIADLILRRLAVEVVDHTLAEAEARRRDGRLEFHDLLVLARQLLRDDEGVRRRLHDRYQHLLIDEFQDTDPIQVELAVRIAADPAHDSSRPWDEVAVEEGRLFFVGDPKQSIYRFRRADIGLFVRAGDRYPAGRTRLDTNFRTVAPVVDFCNALFGSLIERTRVGEPSGASEYEPESQPESEAESESDPTAGEVAQPDYAELRAWRAAIPGDPGPPVVLVGHGEYHATADSLRTAEADDIAATLAQAHAEGWLVEGADGGHHPCGWADMAILLPSRTSLTHLRRALADVGVPYRLETGSLVYATTEVRDLLSILRAIDDPGDEVALLGALRSPAYGCGDDDLLAWARAGRPWSYIGGHVDDAEGPVADALADLRARHRSRPFRTVPEIVDAVLRDRRLFEIALLADTGRDAWRLYRVVLEHARQFADSDPGGMRAFLRWADLQADDKRRASVPVLPEADVDAVRVMTVHGAKGLEFPITAVSGLSGRFPNPDRGAVVRFRPGGGFDVKMKKGLQTQQFDARRTVEDVMGEQEGIRLLYVALTRARDHLVVSTHHKTYRSSDGVKCHAERIAGVVEDLGDELDEQVGVRRLEGSSSHRDDHGTDRDRSIEVPAPVGAGVSEDARARWDHEVSARRRRRSAVLARSEAGGAVSATALSRHLVASDDPIHDPAVDPSEQPGERDRPEAEREPWRRGRAGTEIGRAVHAVLQHADLTDPAGRDVAGLARWQARNEGVVSASAEIEAKARAALACDLVRRATAGRWWREVHVGVPVADVVEASGGAEIDLLEGFVDLLFEAERGLVVVDYKTDEVSSDAAVRAALERYAPQGAAYALAVEAATGRPVTEVHFLFLRGDEAVDVAVPDLEAVMARVRDALATYGVVPDADTRGGER